MQEKQRKSCKFVRFKHFSVFSIFQGTPAVGKGAGTCAERRRTYFEDKNITHNEKLVS